jgi:TldD protein
MKELAKKAVEIMNFKKVSFGDVRVIEERVQNINMKNTELTEMRDDITLGFGVRVLYNGGWGFASSNIMKISEVENVVNRAIEIAKASSMIRRQKVKLAPEPSYKDIWKTPVLKDPFEVSIEKKIDILSKINEGLLRNNLIRIAKLKNDIYKNSQNLYVN